MVMIFPRHRPTEVAVLGINTSVLDSYLDTHYTGVPLGGENVPTLSGDLAH